MNCKIWISGSNKVVWKYEFENQNNERLKAEVVTVCVNMDTFESVKIPKFDRIFNI